MHDTLLRIRTHLNFLSLAKNLIFVGKLQQIGEWIFLGRHYWITTMETTPRI
jgi:hypothetical protein